MARIVKLIESGEEYTTRNDVSQCIAKPNVYKHAGEQMVRLQTFGSNYRQEKGKQSQVLHIDKEIAQQLIEILKNTFNL